MELKLADKADLSVVAELEQTFVFPLSEEELHKLKINETFRILIWKNEREILGHCVLFRVMDEAEITSFSVRKDLRGKGIGSEFLMKLLDYLRSDGAKIAYLDVRESNTAARRLYQKCGFSEIGRRKRFYQKPVEDAIGMGIEL
ncbi:MAG: ribosomal protein S18-alanine N-acetyltransferase [Clostridia bacterium]|nr:ribosomal protein S18-alanine N-acetyltransferase [Clostridia bacterium]